MSNRTALAQTVCGTPYYMGEMIYIYIHVCVCVYIYMCST